MTKRGDIYMNNDGHLPVPGERYNHIKGGLYQIITIAKHSETSEPLVIFQSLSGSYEYYASPLEMFMGINEHGKRWFQLEKGIQDVMGMAVDAANGGKSARPSKEPLSKRIEKLAGSDIFAQNESHGGNNRNSGERVIVDLAEKLNIGSEELAATDNEAEYGNDGIDQLDDREFLFLILDCESSRKMLEILRKHRDRLDNRMLGNIAVALDLVIDSEDDDVIFVQIEQFLQTRARFETDRLR